MSPRPFFVLATLLVACGSTGPSEAEIYYAAALRPGVELAATPAERALLDQIGTLPVGPASFGEETFELGGTYVAASGRTCRRVRTSRVERLACEGRVEESAAWTFVPDPFRASGGETPAVPATYDGTAQVEAP